MAYGNPKQTYERLMATMFVSMGKENKAIELGKGKNK